jgi:dihydropteroate synthase
VLPVVEGLVRHGAVVSLDTRCALVAEAGLSAGARVVNDVSALRDDPALLPLVARRKAAVVLMHRRGRPEERYAGQAYENVVEDVRRFLLDRADACLAAGVERQSIALDPGLGFGKTVEEELALIAGTHRLAETGYPVLIGCSRKSFIGRLTGVEKPADRDPASAWLSVEAVRRGASIVRVHNVVATRQALAVFEAMR